MVFSCKIRFSRRSVGIPPIFSMALRDRRFLVQTRKMTIHERKSLVQHESLHFSVVISAPIDAGKECPADLKFASLGPCQNYRDEPIIFRLARSTATRAPLDANASTNILKHLCRPSNIIVEVAAAGRDATEPYQCLVSRISGLSLSRFKSVSFH